MPINFHWGSLHASSIIFLAKKSFAHSDWANLLFPRSKSTKARPHYPYCNRKLTRPCRRTIRTDWPWLNGVGDALWSADREYLNQYSLNFNYLRKSRPALIGYSFRRSITPMGSRRYAKPISLLFSPWALAGRWLACCNTIHKNAKFRGHCWSTIWILLLEG